MSLDSPWYVHCFDHFRHHVSVRRTALIASRCRRRVLVRRVPRQRERHDVAGLDDEVGDGRAPGALGRRRRREDHRVGTGGGVQPAVEVGHPREVRAVVEAHPEVHVDRDPPRDTLDDADDVDGLARGSACSRSTRTTPSSVWNVVSSTSVSPRYRRSIRRMPPAGASFQRPWSRVPRSAANTAPESNRGTQSQSIEPSLRDERRGLGVADDRVVLDAARHRCFPVYESRTTPLRSRPCPSGRARRAGRATAG